MLLEQLHRAPVAGRNGSGAGRGRAGGRAVLLVLSVAVLCLWVFEPPLAIDGDGAHRAFWGLGRLVWLGGRLWRAGREGVPRGRRLLAVLLVGLCGFAAARAHSAFFEARKPRLRLLARPWFGLFDSGLRLRGGVLLGIVAAWPAARLVGLSAGQPRLYPRSSSVRAEV